MSLLPESGLLRMSCLTNSGIIHKDVSLKNIIPVIFEDYRHSSRTKLWETPGFIDGEMIFYNTLTEEFYLFDREAIWQEENCSHPSLDVGTLFKEKQWLDELRVM